MSYYTTIRCKCIVKEQYRQLIARIIHTFPDILIEIPNTYIKNILTDGSRFGCFFLDNVSGWREHINEEEIAYFFNLETGEWHFHIAINKEQGEIEEFLVRFNPMFLTQIYFLEIYNENSADHYLKGNWDNYLVTNLVITELVEDFGNNWTKNICLN